MKQQIKSYRTGGVGVVQQEEKEGGWVERDGHVWSAGLYVRGALTSNQKEVSGIRSFYLPPDII